MQGIVLRPVVPYAHSQNGFIERAIWTIIEGVRCMLAESGLSKELWAEAAATQIHTRNRLLSVRHKGVPEEKWSGKRQNVVYLRPFGCIVFAKVLKELIKSKLEPKLVKCVLVGYAGMGGYRLFDKTS